MFILEEDILHLEADQHLHLLSLDPVLAPQVRAEIEEEERLQKNIIEEKGKTIIKIFHSENYKI